MSVMGRSSGCAARKRGDVGGVGGSVAAAVIAAASFARTSPDR